MHERADYKDALHNAFRDLRAKHDRIAIIGGPNTGKTTLSRLAMDRFILHTDVFIDKVEFKQVPFAVIATVLPLDRFVVEGFQVARSLRKGMAVDCIVWLTKPHTELTNRQRGMIKSVATVMGSFTPKAPVIMLGDEGATAERRPEAPPPDQATVAEQPTVDALRSGIVEPARPSLMEELEGPPEYDF